MKNLLLGFAILGLAVACKTNDNANISDSSNVAAPEAEAGCEMKDGAGCEMEDAAGCDMKKDAADCDMKDAAGCDKGAAKEGCSKSKAAVQVCPMTGEAVEN